MRNAVRAFRFQCVLILAALAALWLVGPVLAAGPDDLVKDINKILSAVQRRIPTDPTRAAGDLEEAGKLLDKLKAEAPDNPKIASLQKKFDDLDGKLAKRLGKTVKPVEKAEAPAPPSQPAAPAVAKPSAPAAPETKAAEAGAKLPGGVTSRLKKLEDTLKKAEAYLGKDDPMRAQGEVERASKVMKEIEDKYGDQIPAGNAEMEAAKARLAAVSEKANSAAGAQAADKEKAAKEKAAREGASAEWLAKLKPFVYEYSDKRINMRPEAGIEELKKNKALVDEASGLLAEYKKAEFPAGKTKELEEVEAKLGEVLQKFEPYYAKSMQKGGQSEEWLVKLRPFVTGLGQPGHDATKYLIPSGTADVKELISRKQAFDQAKAAFAEYQKADFSAGKSEELERVEKDLARRLEEFPKAYDESIEMVVGEVEKKVAHWLKYLEGKSEWRQDKTQKPAQLASSTVAELRKMVGVASQALPADSPRLAGLNKQLEALLKENDERGRIRAERTFMTADRFKGPEMDQVKAKAAALVQKDFPDAKVLRTTVISEDWKEEEVVEHTDTTKTALRHRITRSVTAQAAAKRDSGQVFIYTIYVAKDRRSDGTWGQLYGNLHQYGDLILEENVNR